MINIVTNPLTIRFVDRGFNPSQPEPIGKSSLKAFFKYIVEGDLYEGFQKYKGVQTQIYKIRNDKYNTYDDVLFMKNDSGASLRLLLISPGNYPYASFTVELKQYRPIGPDCALINIKNLPEALDMIKSYHIGNPTGRYVEGYPEFRFTPEFLRRI